MLPFEDGVDIKRFYFYAAGGRVQVIYVGGSISGKRGSPLPQVMHVMWSVRGASALTT